MNVLTILNSSSAKYIDKKVFKYVDVIVPNRVETIVNKRWSED